MDLRVACGYAQQRRLMVAFGYEPSRHGDERVATGYHVPVLGERSRRLRSEYGYATRSGVTLRPEGVRARLRYAQMGRPQATRS